MTSDARALVLTGTIGAGKTSIAEAISVELHERGVRHGLLALDWLGQVYPPLDSADPFNLELHLENIAAIVPNFTARGVDRYVVSATITSRAELDALRDALGRVEVIVGLVTAPDETLLARIRRRDEGALRDDFLDRAVALGRAIASERMEDFVVDNPDGSLKNVVATALAFVGWG